MPEIPLTISPGRNFMPEIPLTIFPGRRSTPWGRLLPSGRKNFMSEIRFAFFHIQTCFTSVVGSNVFFIQIKHALHHLPFLIAGSAFGTLLEDGHVVLPLLLSVLFHMISFCHFYFAIFNTGAIWLQGCGRLTTRPSAV